MTWDEIFILIERAQAGDRAAFGELVQRFQPAVYAVAMARLREAFDPKKMFNPDKIFPSGARCAELRPAFNAASAVANVAGAWT